MIDILLAATLTWQLATTRDALGSSVYVAEVAPGGSQSLRFLCGGITGVVLQFNLGQLEAERDAFSLADPKPEVVRFKFAEGSYDTTAVRAPIVDGIGTYEIKGEEAVFVLTLIRDSEPVLAGIGGDTPNETHRVEVQHGGAAALFSLSGAKAAIEDVRAACPYKYPKL
jgi:hypothetical protein